LEEARLQRGNQEPQISGVRLRVIPVEIKQQDKITNKQGEIPQLAKQRPAILDPADFWQVDHQHEESQVALERFGLL
jgi:hypothetical protein